MKNSFTENIEEVDTTCQEELLNIRYYEESNINSNVVENWKLDIVSYRQIMAQYCFKDPCDKLDNNV